MSFSTPCLTNEYRCVWFFNIPRHPFFYLMLALSMDSPCLKLGNTKMFLLTTTKMSEFITIHPSHFGCIKSAVLIGLRRMYIDSSCPNHGIGIKISDLLIGPPSPSLYWIQRLLYGIKPYTCPNSKHAKAQPYPSV